MMHVEIFNLTGFSNDCIIFLLKVRPIFLCKLRLAGKLQRFVDESPNETYEKLEEFLCKAAFDAVGYEMETKSDRKPMQYIS